jgi:hypothetical protein
LDVCGVLEAGVEVCRFVVVAGVTGVADAGVTGATGVEGGGIRVTGVVTTGRIGFGSGGMGLRFPDGGGILVTGVAIRRGGTGAGTGARGKLLGTGGIGADCIDVVVPVPLGRVPATGVNDGVGILVTGVFGIVVTGVIGFGAPKLAIPVPVVAAPPKFDFGVPKRLAALIYCANAAFCSGVAVLFATACRIALNSGLVAAISVRALTVKLFACAADVCAAGTGRGGGGGGATLTGFSGLGGFSAFSSTLRTDRNRVSGKMCGPMTTGQMPRRVVMYWDDGAGSFLPRRVGFQTLGKW